jgi:hypothetical protein
MDKALAWYRILYGRESDRDGAMAWFDFPRSDTRLILHETDYRYGSETGIASFGIKTEAFERSAASDLLAELGATVLEGAEMTGGLRFTDPDGITVELNPV